MRYEQCKECKCSSCMQNVADYADGMCRQCETCIIDGCVVATEGCKHYESDNDPSGLI